MESDFNVTPVRDAPSIRYKLDEEQFSQLYSTIYSISLFMRDLVSEIKECKEAIRELGEEEELYCELDEDE